MRIAMPEFDNRTLGAIAIAFAGVLLGFAAGRLSAWVVPPAGLAVATSSGTISKPSIPLEADRAQKDAQRRREGAPSEAAVAKPAEPKLPAGAADGAKPALPGVTSRALSPADPQGGPEPAGRPKDRQVTVINPGGAQKQDPQQQRPSQFGPQHGPQFEPQYRPSDRISDRSADEMRALTDGIELCRRKYRSFDPSDGTYKPYGQDHRVSCPHLR